MKALLGKLDCVHITFNLLRAVKQYSNMVWGSRNTEKKKKMKEAISVLRFIKMKF